MESPSARPETLVFDQSMDPSTNLDIPLDLFGQADSLSIITPFVYIFALPNPDIAHLTSVIGAGLERLTDTFPWVAGRITNTGRTSESSGIFKITPHKAIPELTVRDWRDDTRVPTMDHLGKAGIPCSMIKEEFFAPVHVNTTPGFELEDRSPILQLQLSIIIGGVVFSLMANHQALDGIAQDQIACLLDKACNNIPYTAEEVRTGNLRRETIVKPFDSAWQPGVGEANLQIPETTITKADMSKPYVEHRWTHICFSPTALKALKSDVSRSLGSGFVSTDDALTALIWQSVSRARSVRLPASASTTISRAVNPRKYLDIPATYPGYVNSNACSSGSIDCITRCSLASIALELRTKVDPLTSGLRDSTRGVATMLYRAKDRNTVPVHGSVDSNSDIMLSSWANMRGYDFDFGLGLGKPTHFRRMDHQRIPSLAFLLPRRPDGEIILSICLRIDDIALLRLDSTFTTYGRFIM